MKRQNSIRLAPSIRFVAVMLISAGIVLSSMSAVAEGPIPFNAMMQTGGAQAAVPAKPSGQQASPGPITNTGKTEIGAGLFLFAAGVATISITALLNTGGFKPSSGKSSALYAVGGGATAGGVTLIALGFHRRKPR
jgi:hypothetical protein